MNDNQKMIISLVSVAIPANTVVEETTINNFVSSFSMMYPLDKNEESEVLKVLHSRLAIRMDRGAFIEDKNHIKWYDAAKKDIITEFWDRYLLYLRNDVGFSPSVIDTLDITTDDMMDLLGNPNTEKDYQRRGLVIGDVQSGKTATYTALINKAADSGYRVIILLTGTIEKLRKQTQSRLDEGFTGLDSTALTRDKSSVLVGVGNYNSNITVMSLTSTMSDFNKATAEKIGFQLKNIKSPVLFVVKKNKSVLEKLEQWLRLFNEDMVRKTSSLPMLLIDDEADNASVNTKSENNPTAINDNIRKLLNLFSKANYLGFTATPFANIFINPESTNKMLRDDLFPRDFIYALEAPTNYVGARSIFADKGLHSYMLKANDDCEDYIPEKHKQYFVPSDLPDTLKRALASFFIVNTIRDLRGQTDKHRTMLINISRFILVQEQIKEAIDAYVREVRREIKNYHLLGIEALAYESITFIKSVFDDEFSKTIEFDWNEIQKKLYESIAAIVVRSVNGGNASKNLNYDEYPDDGLRLIAIGGYSLSRGLTLEGLCISYFYRNSKMYDTLMQMGRWFGYRDGYADLCQIWMSEDAIDWYRYISVASDELRNEIRRMKEQNKTPKDFGLSVRSDINMLQVSAPNKMKTAKNYTETVSLNGTMIETKFVHSENIILKTNLRITEDWIKGLVDEGYQFADTENLAINNPQLLNIPKKYICEYLKNYNSHYLNMAFQTDKLVEFIYDYNDDSVDLWDIVIASGKGDMSIFCQNNIRYVERNFGIKRDSKAIQMSDTKSRLGNIKYAKGGLKPNQVNTVENIARKIGYKGAFNEELYFRSGIKRNPLLVIYPVQLKAKTNAINDPTNKMYKKKLSLSENLDSPIIGLSIGIPDINGKENRTLKYKINLIKYRELLNIDDDFEEDDGLGYDEQ